jgi:cytosine/adenosine deaminase-related metal-dependent hydrolase
MMAANLLIKNGLVLRGDAFDPVRADLSIEEGRIAAIGDAIAPPPDATVIDADGAIVAPGFVDTHRHVWQTQLRGVAADWSLLDYFVNMRMRYAPVYEAEDAYLGNLLGAVEALDAGVTTVVDHCHVINSPDHADGALAGLSESGIRAVFAYGSFDNFHKGPPGVLDRNAPGNEWRTADFERIAARISCRPDDRIRLGYAPSEGEALPWEQFVEEIALARRVGAHAISVHVAMGGYDQGKRCVTRLADAGLLDRDLLFVHGAALRDEELAAMAQTGAGLSVTPETEMQMGMGYPAAFRAAAAGVRCGLGVDIVSNYAGDMATAARMALQLERARRNDAIAGQGQIPLAITPRAAEAYRLATLGSAEAIGLAREIGSLAPGKAADIIIVRTDTPATAPSTDPVATLLFYARPADVDTVIVGGRIVKRSGQIVGVPLADLLDRLQASSVAVRARAARTSPEAIYAAMFGGAPAS